MLAQDPFNHGLLRKYQVAFGSLFNEVVIQRTDDSGVVQSIPVPVSYAAKEKVLARVFADPDIQRPTAVTLPRMSFEMLGMRYNGANKLRSVGRNRVAVTPDRSGVERVLNPVPYDLKFSLFIYTKYQSDANQIIEQVLPFFTPTFTMTLNLIPEIGVNVDCQVLLESVDQSFSFVDEGRIRDHRILMWRLDFSVTAYLYGPIITQPVIKFANATFVDQTSNIAIDRVTVQPGLTSNGQPTTNASLTVQYSDIDADDPWDYVVTISGDLDPAEGSV